MVISQETNAKRHLVRSILAGLTGTFAILLITTSIVAIWFNRTLTNTPTYVKTVAPLVSEPPIQQFIAAKVTDEITDKAPLADLANTLLSKKQLARHHSDDQLKKMVEPLVEQTVLRIVQSDGFAKIWKEANQTAHSQLLKQLDNDSQDLALDFSPAISGALDQLKTTQLKPIVDKLDIKPVSGNLHIKSDAVNRIRSIYKLIQSGTLVLVILALASIVATIFLSVHHQKTARRLLIATGIVTLLQGILLSLPSMVKLGGQDELTQNAAKAIVQSLLHGLQIGSLIIGVASLTGAVAWKLYENRQK